MKSIENKSVVLSCVFINHSVKILARDIDNINDKNVFVNDFVNTKVNTKLMEKLISLPDPMSTKDNT